jgi:DNA-binding GntR family transcriptional regulator
MLIEVLQRDTSPEAVLELLRKRIIDGTFQPGMQLKQSIISSQLGVSVSPVREALIRLVEEGLVENPPYRGMFVRRLTPKDVVEIYQLRLALEFLAIQLDLPKFQIPENLEKAYQLVQHIHESERANDFEQATISDLNFHRYFVELSGNSRLLKIWDSIYGQSRYILRNLYSVQTLQPDKTMEFGDHLVILDAISNGNQEQIYLTLSKHMDYAIQTLEHLWTLIAR